MKIQITLAFDDVIIPRKENVLESNVLIDRGSKYGYSFTQVNGKEDLKNFLKLIKNIKPFDSADHCSYAFRLRSPELILIE